MLRDDEFQKEPVDAKGWSRWIQPRMDKYHMACCDCGLVHTIKFQVRQITSEDEQGVYSTRVGGFLVWFKAKRANGLTKALRKRDLRNG